MASIRKRNGKHHVQIRLRGFPQVTETFDRKSDAEKWAKATETDMQRRVYFPQHEAERHTIADLVERQLEHIKVKRAHDYERHKGILGMWKERLGAYTLATPNLSDLIGRERDRLHNQEGLAAGTINRYMASLSVAFSNAVKEWKWLPHSANPMPGVAKLKEPKGRCRYLSDEERVRLLEACRKSEFGALYLMVLLSLTTGLRRGEMLGLHWSDIDLERRDKHGNPAPLAVLKNTKNGDVRAVPIVPEVASLIREHGRVRRLDSDLVFCSGGSSEVNDFDQAWYRALKQAKVKDFRWHDLRHSAASYLAMSHASLAEIAAVLGHRTLAMVKRYSHLSDQHVGEVVERMARKYFSA